MFERYYLGHVSVIIWAKFGRNIKRANLGPDNNIQICARNFLHKNVLKLLFL